MQNVETRLRISAVSDHLKYFPAYTNRPKQYLMPVLFSMRMHAVFPSSSGLLSFGPQMKAVLLLTLLLVAALVQDTEAGWFRQLGRRVKAGAKRLGERVRNGARRVLDAVKDTARGRLRDEVSI